jgi:hypothetical protein
MGDNNEGEIVYRSPSGHSTIFRCKATKPSPSKKPRKFRTMAQVKKAEARWRNFLLTTAMLAFLLGGVGFGIVLSHCLHF